MSLTDPCTNDTLLYSLFKPLTSVDGLDESIVKLFDSYNKKTVKDILWHLPRQVIDRQLKQNQDLSSFLGQIVSVIVTIKKHYIPSKPHQPYRVHAEYQGYPVTLVFFNARSKYIHDLLPTGEAFIISGKLDIFDEYLQITNPDFILPLTEAYKLPLFQAIYTLPKTISAKLIGKVVGLCLKHLPDMPEWLEKEKILQNGWPSWKEAFDHVHRPQNEKQASLSSQARQRLAYDEMLAHHLRLGLLRQNVKKQSACRFLLSKDLYKQALESLPFQLTKDQHTVIDEMNKDLSSGQKMFRLLQGDVGSGKTIVAFMASLGVIESQGQVAMMVPTEILANQHYKNLQSLAEKLNIKIGLLTGREKGKIRKTLLQNLKEGKIDFLIGTHALIESDVEFKNLGLAIIDEQHRFGVEQRSALSEKNTNPVHILVMSATPIPRTLSLAAYGEMDLSILRTKPAGRKPIQTRVLGTNKLKDILEGLKRQLAEGARAYWVCPLVDESEKSDMAAATERFQFLMHHFGAETVRMVHGKMKGADKEKAMDDFSSGKASILVSTTVIEVGVNVPEATIMIVENAQRFGLAQLHQLRGRVGRGDKSSSCLLVYSYPLTEIATERLKIMRETDDGFLIAEKDLQLRGAGDILGKRQSGLAFFKFSDPRESLDLQEQAFHEARSLLEKDPILETEQGKKLRYLLAVFSDFQNDASHINVDNLLVS